MTQTRKVTRKRVAEELLILALPGSGDALALQAYISEFDAAQDLTAPLVVPSPPIAVINKESPEVDPKDLPRWNEVCRFFRELIVDNLDENYAPVYFPLPKT